ncbi:RNA polymerase sigma factor, sigma-70 family [Sphingobacterium deserti]|uniref:RNA polymerase sigma factor, sigma-70 family n=2 Tax=Sphingobacterium deserti TaxID=1229276 RepID=A0A0B8T341_9SPHI|nr:RNA polymerase sigma factor, sigma-70 family [Sphingobacterium deserti]
MLQHGEERGLSFFYKRFFSALLKRTTNSLPDKCAAESIVQEAFLRLWIFRQKIAHADDILPFLQAQVSAAIKSFYCITQNRFHRSLLRLDDSGHYKELLQCYDLEEDNVTNIEYSEQLAKQNMEKVMALLPHLPKEQQLIIGFCLKYSFNYERIAYYLGGISDYEVCLKIEKTIELLKTILNNDSKIATVNKMQHIATQGLFDETQAEIFRMRYELQLSFEEISIALKMNAAVVKKLFVNAHAQIKKSKQTA